MQVPRSNMYSTPPETVLQRRLHYIIVQISKYRYIVAEYQDGIQFDDRSNRVLGYVVVTNPMKYQDAVDKAKELTEARTTKKE